MRQETGFWQYQQPELDSLGKRLFRGEFKTVEERNDLFDENLEVMKRAMEEKVSELGATPDVKVISDDSWSTDRITPAGREKLRAAGFAPPAPREASAPKLVQLQANVFRCPYCGSTETRLENIFGPTPCRSLRYCESCRQPFEQFKTI